jgi:hypothetical protein
MPARQVAVVRAYGEIAMAVRARGEHSRIGAALPLKRAGRHREVPAIEHYGVVHAR